MAGEEGTKRAWKREARGPTVVLAAILAIELMTRFVVRIPNPPAILVLLVVFAAFHAGLRASLVSAGLAWAYLTWAFSVPGQPFHYAPDDLTRVVIWGVTLPALAVMVGRLEARAVAAEKAVRREAETRFTKAFHASPVGILLTRLSDGRVLDANEAALDLLGYAREELVGKPLLSLGAWAEPEQRAALVERLRTEGTVRNVDVQARKRSGEVADLLCSFERLDDEIDGHAAPQALSFIVDITERRRAVEALRRREEQLHETQKMEAVGRLAGGIAHDFNNLLTVIGGNASLVEANVADPDARQCLAEITDATERAASLTRQLLAFSRHEPLRSELLDVNAVVEKLVPFLRRTIGERIVLSADLAPSLGAIRADPGQIDQAVTNLVINARDAMANGGELTLRTAEVELDDAAAAPLGVEARAGRFVVLAIRDTGAGMDADTARRVFEPFFTTKGAAQGTGLGLATVYGIVARSGGFVSVESEVGEGTEFRLHFPTAGEAAEVGPGAEHRAAARGRERVLLVEDEPAVRALAARVLEELGYTVLVADSAKHALEIAAAEAKALELVITDVVMPEMGGRELAERITPLLPKAKILFVSGYANDPVLAQSIRDRSVAFLAKPFTRESLASAVRAVLDDAPAHAR
jgi:PAS domain S-box-containing protein